MRINAQDGANGLLDVARRELDQRLTDNWDQVVKGQTGTNLVFGDEKWTG